MDTNKYNAQIQDLANDLRSYVSGIESGIKTTQNHYGKYLEIFMMAGNDKTSLAIMADALMIAGANHAGVASAYNYVKGAS